MPNRIYFDMIQAAVQAYEKHLPGGLTLPKEENARVNYLEKTNKQGHYIYPPLVIIPPQGNPKESVACGQQIRTLLLGTSRYQNQSGMFGLSGSNQNVDRIFVVGEEGSFICRSLTHQVSRNEIIKKFSLNENKKCPGAVVIVGSAIGSLTKKLNFIMMQKKLEASQGLLLLADSVPASINDNDANERNQKRLKGWNALPVTNHGLFSYPEYFAIRAVINIDNSLATSSEHAWINEHSPKYKRKATIQT